MATASSISYGQTLSSSTLSAESRLPQARSPSPRRHQAERGHGITERDLHAHRYHRLQHVDRHGQRDGEQGDVVRDDLATAARSLTADAGILDAVSGASTPAGSFAFTTRRPLQHGYGSQSVTFTPTDATDYSTLTGTAA